MDSEFTGGLSRTWRLVPSAELFTHDGRIALCHSLGTLEFVAPPPVELVLRAMASDELDEGAVAALVAVASIGSEQSELAATLESISVLFARLSAALVVTFYDNKEMLVRFSPLGLGAGPLSDEIAADEIELSRFAYLAAHPREAHLCLRSPLSWYRAQPGDDVVRAVAQMASAPVAVADLAPRDRVAMAALASAGMVVPARSEQNDARLATWSFHDLVFHSLSRPGRSDEPLGAHFAHGDLAAPPTIVTRAGARIALTRPEFAEVTERDLTLTEALESRHSVRMFDDEPPSAEQLGELLWRCQRARREVPVVGSPLVGLERPYPTGGLAADLEIHLVVRRCTGIVAGLYVYDGATHELVLEGDVDSGADLVYDANVSTGMALDPPILVVITSRFARIGWKYERISYSVTMKHVGILIQTIYLVATSMGLGACALGSGNPTSAARIFGLDWLVESSVGEMLLGRDPAPQTATEFAHLKD